MIEVLSKNFCILSSQRILIRDASESFANVWKLLRNESFESFKFLSKGIQENSNLVNKIKIGRRLEQSLISKNRLPNGCSHASGDIESRVSDSVERINAFLETRKFCMMKR